MGGGFLLQVMSQVSYHLRQRLATQKGPENPALGEVSQVLGFARQQHSALAQFLLDLKAICRNIATINRTRMAGGFSGRLSPGNQLAPCTI
ncbi:hypothetical protein CES86_5511 [Brucella lupini]|uniref:Uncharacterized protein n=1 Tax=Brucella lupini TaxID=255457 RepID=A0A256H060_9HYPH|nr:hypothetical protein CES86_5511 [Brucella lupini]